MCQRTRQDDPTITDEDRLFRRVHLSQIVKDEDTGWARISTGAFKDKELSINIESVLRQNGEAEDACLRNHRLHKLVSFTAGQARQFEQTICRDPEPPDNLSHGLVCGSKNNKRIYEGLRDCAQWDIPAQAPRYAEIAEQKKAVGLPV